MIEENYQEEIFFNKPSLTHRIKSMIIDTMVLIFLMMLFTNILGALDIKSGLVRGICFGLVVLYEPILVTMGSTIGQKIVGLSVINYAHYKKDNKKHNIHFISSLIRYALKISLGWLSLLTIHSDIYGRAIHDKGGNSIMTFK